MVGTQVTYQIIITNFCNNNVTDEKQIQQIKENIGQLPKILGKDLLENYCTNDMDNVQVEVISINYIEPEDLDSFITIE